MKSVTSVAHDSPLNCHKARHFLYHLDTDFHNLVRMNYRSNTQRRKGSREKEQVYLWRTHFPQVNTSQLNNITKFC